MKNWLGRLIGIVGNSLLLLILLFILSCGPGKLLTWEKVGYGDIMVEEIKDLRPKEFKDICQKDTIPENLDLWEKTWFRDYETNEVVYQFGYMKRQDTIYILLQSSSGWTITKRSIRQRPCSDLYQHNSTGQRLNIHRPD